MHATQESFWSDHYRGRSIAVLRHGGSWLVYLDHMLQNNMRFATADAAVAWLRRRIDRTAGLEVA